VGAAGAAADGAPGVHSDAPADGFHDPALGFIIILLLVVTKKLVVL